MPTTWAAPEPHVLKETVIDADHPALIYDPMVDLYPIPSKPLRHDIDQLIKNNPPLTLTEWERLVEICREPGPDQFRDHTASDLEARLVPEGTVSRLKQKVAQAKDLLDEAIAQRDARPSKKAKEQVEAARQYLSERKAILASANKGPQPIAECDLKLLDDIQDRFTELAKAEKDSIRLDAQRGLAQLSALLRSIIASNRQVPASALLRQLLSAFLIGQTYARAEARTSTVVNSGLKAKQRSRQGGKDSSAARRLKQPPYQAEVDALMQQGAKGGLSYHKATQLVAEKHDVSIGTVRRHTTNNWPKAGGRPNTD